MKENYAVRVIVPRFNGVERAISDGYILMG